MGEKLDTPQFDPQTCKDAIYSEEYMPLLIRAENEEEKTLKTMNIFQKVFSYSSTIKLETSSKKIHDSLKQISGIGDF